MAVRWELANRSQIVKQGLDVHDAGFLASKALGTSECPPAAAH